MMDRNQKAGPKGKKLNQVSSKFESEVYARLKRACEIQQHRDGQLVRILTEWALPHYEEARSVEALYSIDSPLASSRVSRETQEMLFAALRTILDHAPETVIERVVGYITKRAGKYGKEL